MAFKFISHSRKVKRALTEAEENTLDAIGKLVKKDAVRRVEAHNLVRTGNLKRNIDYKVQKKEKAVDIGVKPDAFYALFLEKGASSIKEKPFLTPAAEQNLAAIRAMVKEMMDID